jgi:hypothetical protein
MSNQVEIQAILKPFYPKAVSPEAIEALIREAIEELKVKQAHALLNQLLEEQARHTQQQISLAIQALQHLRNNVIPFIGVNDPDSQDQWVLLRQKMSLLPDNVLRDAQADLEPKLLTFKKAVLVLQNFRAVHKLKRDCKQPNLYKALFLKILALVIEARVNAQLLAGLTTYGGQESVILAVTISLLNLGMASLLGVCLNFTPHVDAPIRFKAWWASISLAGCSLAWCIL